MTRRGRGMLQLTGVAFCCPLVFSRLLRARSSLSYSREIKVPILLARITSHPPPGLPGAHVHHGLLFPRRASDRRDVSRALFAIVSLHVRPLRAVPDHLHEIRTIVHIVKIAEAADITRTAFGFRCFSPDYFSGISILRPQNRGWMGQSATSLLLTAIKESTNQLFTQSITQSINEKNRGRGIVLCFRRRKCLRKKNNTSDEIPATATPRNNTKTSKLRINGRLETAQNGTVVEAEQKTSSKVPSSVTVLLASIPIAHGSIWLRLLHTAEYKCTRRATHTKEASQKHNEKLSYS